MKIPYGKCVQSNDDIKAVIRQLKKSTQMGGVTIKFENYLKKNMD